MATRTRAGARDASDVLTQAMTEREQKIARVEAMLTEADALRRRIARDFWELGRVLGGLRAEEAHVVLGFDRFDNLITERLGLAATTAFKLIAVADRLPRTEAVALGQEKAYAILTYADAAPDAVEPVALVRNDALVGDKPLSRSSVRDIVAATAAVRPPRPQSLAARRRAQEDRATARALGEQLGLPRGAVSVEGDGFVIRLTRRQVARALK